MRIYRSNMTSICVKIGAIYRNRATERPTDQPKDPPPQKKPKKNHTHKKTHKKNNKQTITTNKQNKQGR
jgi:hypothetical protein